MMHEMLMKWLKPFSTCYAYDTADITTRVLSLFSKRYPSPYCMQKDRTPNSPSVPFEVPPLVPCVKSPAAAFDTPPWECPNLRSRMEPPQSFPVPGPKDSKKARNSAFFLGVRDRTPFRVFKPRTSTSPWAQGDAASPFQRDRPFSAPRPTFSAPRHQVSYRCFLTPSLY